MDRSPRGVLRATGIGSPGLIDVLGRAIAAISHHECRDGIDCYLKLSFGLPLQLAQYVALLLCDFAILDIGCRSVPFHDVARSVAQRHAMNQVPAILPVRSSQTH